METSTKSYWFLGVRQKRIVETQTQACTNTLGFNLESVFEHSNVKTLAGWEIQKNFWVSERPWIPLILYVIQFEILYGLYRLWHTCTPYGFQIYLMINYWFSKGHYLMSKSLKLRASNQDSFNFSINIQEQWWKK